MSAERAGRFADVLRKFGLGDDDRAAWEESSLPARERAPGAEVVLGSAERLPFADGSFTAIAMSIVFFFLPDPIAVLCERRRVLARGGRLAL